MGRDDRDDQRAVGDLMNIGDTIRCHDLDDLINTMIECARSGIETDFDYSEDKPRLIVTAITEEEQCQK